MASWADDWNPGYTPGEPLEALSRRRLAGTVGGRVTAESLQLQDYGSSTPWMMDALAGAARGLAGALEPFQLPQDIMFSLLAGWADKDKSALDYFRGDQTIWESITAYAPGGIAPDRPASGEELLRLFGVRDERAAKWGGIAMDLVADPLIAGAWVKGAGLVARGMGLADTAKDLMRLGERADYITSFRPAYDAIPKVMRDNLEDGAFALAQAAFNNRVFWNRAEDAATWGDMLLPRRQALRLQMMSGRGDTLGRESADFIARTEQTARSAGTTIQEQAVMKAQEALDALGGGIATSARDRAANAAARAGRFAEDLTGSVMSPEEQRGFLARGMRILGQKARSVDVVEKANMPTSLRQLISKDGWEVIDQQGVAAMLNQIDPRITVPKEVGERSTTLMQRFEKRVRAQATRVGYDADEAWERAQVFVQKATEADAMLGYHLSGYEYVSTKFGEAALSYYQRQGFSAEEAAELGTQTWNDALIRASRGESAVGTPLRSRPYDPKPGEGLSPLSSGTGFTPTTGAMQVFEADRAMPTIKDIIDGADTFSSLSIDNFMTGIFNGHMRRAFGIMQDPGSFERYVKGVERGKVFLSNVLDDTFRNIPDEYAVEFGHIRNLLDNLKPAEGSGRGTLLSRDTIVAHLADQGVEPERIRDVMIELVRQQNPVLGREGGVLDRLQDLRATLAGRVSNPSREGGTFGRGFFSQREELDAQQLELLGEFANPIVSISETASKARSAVPFSVFMRETYDQAKANGFVRDAGETGRYVDPVSKVRYLKIPDEEVGIWGAYAGKLVHPMLKKELLNAMKDRGGKVGTWERVRSLITGGYLASPNVIMANMSGGFFQAAALGVTPDRLVPKMASTLKKLVAHDERGEKYDVLEILARYFDLDDSTLVGQNIAHAFKKMELTESGLGPDGLNKWFTEVSDFLGEQLKRPGIGKVRSRWFGLDGFQFVERWFKVAAYEAEYDRLIATGIKQLEAEKMAAEMARLVVFDYSELPGLFKGLRDTGLLMFPGFNYFLVPRILNSAMNRPGVLSVSDRISDALTNAIVDDDQEKHAIYANMPEWLRNEQGSIVNRYVGEDGTMRYTAIPTGQLVPTNGLTLAGNAWGESVATAGLWRPILEMLYATVQGDGEAVFSGRYGQRVFDPGATRPEQVSQTWNFLMSNFTPGFVRKLGVDPASIESLFDQSQAPRGLVPNLLSRAFELNEPMGELAYSLSEMQRQRPDRSLRDEFVSFTLRAPQPIATSGALANIQGNYEQARRRLTEMSQADRRKLQAATLAGNDAVAAKIRSRILKREQDFIEEWRPMITAWTQGGR